MGLLNECIHILRQRETGLFDKDIYKLRQIYLSFFNKDIFKISPYKYNAFGDCCSISYKYKFSRKD